MKLPEISVLDHCVVPPVDGSEMTELMLVLHGRGDSYEGFAWLPQALAISGLGYVMVNAPDDYYGGFSWYDLPPNQEDGIVRSRKILDQLFDELCGESVAGRIDPKSLFVFGFSQGCLMSWEWGGRLPTQLGGVIGVSGYVFNSHALVEEFTEQAKATPRLITHGRQDDVLPFSDSELQADFLRDSGVPFEWHEYEKDHTIAPEEIAMIRHWIVERI